MEGRKFLFGKLHSLLGVVPIGAFLIMHLSTNFQATKGPETFNAWAGFLESLPFLLFLEVVFIYLPILYHGVYGLYVAFQASPNLGNFGTFRNWMFVLQRVTGIIAFIFIIWHVWETRFARDPHLEDFYSLMSGILSNPAMYIFYLVGVLATVFHFSNGMWSFLVSWGVTIGPRAQKMSTYVWAVVFILLSIVSVMSINAFV